jgi:4-amino-4-deoxy-L-arabinose transferase-like glycosyltransferase
VPRRSLILSWLLAFALLILGFGLRLYDLTDQPIDFHATRQLRGALIARGMYYRMLPNVDEDLRDRAIAFGSSTGQYEPSILEYIVARTYLLMGQEAPWVARVYNSLFWIIAGLALFDLARRAVSPWAGLVSLGYYLILPFAVQASRSFQPDPGMVMWIVLTFYALYRWSEQERGASWTWAILAGVFGGIGVLTKVVAAYLVGGAAVGMVLYTLGVRRFWRSLQVWVMAVLMVTPTALYYGARPGRASEYFQGWTLSLSHLLLDPSLYVRWFSLVQSLMGLAALLLALTGVLLAIPRLRGLLLGLWVGYIVYGLFLPYQMYTHSYYHLQLVPIVALSLAPAVGAILERLALQARLHRVLFAGIFLIGIAFSAWQSVAELKREDYRGEPAYWQQIASYLPTDGKIVGLTQDYGYRLEYYGWRKVSLWPVRGERTLASLRGGTKEFEDYFAKRTEGKDYFLITSFNQLSDQPDLKQYLPEHYPLIAQGSGYLIYDLAHPLP